MAQQSVKRPWSAVEWRAIQALDNGLYAGAAASFSKAREAAAKAGIKPQELRLLISEIYAKILHFQSKDWNMAAIIKKIEPETLALQSLSEENKPGIVSYLRGRYELPPAYFLPNVYETLADLLCFELVPGREKIVEKLYTWTINISTNQKARHWRVKIKRTLIKELGNFRKKYPESPIEHSKRGNLLELNVEELLVTCKSLADAKSKEDSLQFLVYYLESLGLYLYSLGDAWNRLGGVEEVYRIAENHQKELAPETSEEKRLEASRSIAEEILGSIGTEEVSTILADENILEKVTPMFKVLSYEYAVDSLFLHVDKTGEKTLETTVKKFRKTVQAAVVGIREAKILDPKTSPMVSARLGEKGKVVGILGGLISTKIKDKKTVEIDRQVELAITCLENLDKIHNAKFFALNGVVIFETIYKKILQERAERMTTGRKGTLERAGLLHGDD